MPLTSRSAAAPLAGNRPDGNETFLDGLERELVAWNARLAKVCNLPRKVSRSARIEHRKRILVSKVRHRNIERRLADMRGSEERFSTLRPGLLLLWKLFTSGIEKAEA